jgi:hypothetical protein
MELQNLMPFDNWLKLFTTIGQMLAGIGALIAAWYAYRTVKNLGNQSEIMQKDYLSRFGPKLHISWQPTDNINNINLLELFPITELAVSQLQDRRWMQIFNVISEWWKTPSSNSNHANFVLLIIENNQVDPTTGMAKNISAKLEIYIKNRKVSHPPHSFSELDIKFGDCRAGNKLEIPINVEGIPDFSFKIKSLTYQVEQSNIAF